MMNPKLSATFFLLHSQSHQLMRPIDAALQAASVCTASLVTPAASTVTAVCAAPTAHTSGEMGLLLNSISVFFIDHVM